MSNFIRTRIQIEDGPIDDTYNMCGFIYLSSDHRVAPPEKPREVTTYVEQVGENVDPRTVDDAFDYVVKFLIECPNSDKDNANIRIRIFNDAIRTIDPETHIKTCKQITFYNDYKRVKIVGIPDLISEPTEFYRQQNGKILDCVLIELKIHVSNPHLCDFSLEEDPNGGSVTWDDGGSVLWDKYIYDNEI